MKSIQHIALNCTDIKKQENFYTTYFGFRRARVFNKGESNEFIMLRLGSTCIELFKSNNSKPDVMGGEQQIGFKHLAFEVSDIEEIVQALHQGGIKTDEIVDCSSVVEGLRVCFFRDPDGNILELMEGYQDEIE